MVSLSSCNPGFACFSPKVQVHTSESNKSKEVNSGIETRNKLMGGPGPYIYGRPHTARKNRITFIMYRK